jgi:hypothetical protein
MRIESLWIEMEREAISGNQPAWLSRFALPQPSNPLLAALETANCRRALLLPLPKSTIPPRRDWPDCRGLEIFTVALDGQPHWGVRLRDAGCADVFAALAEDVAPRLAAAPTPRAAATALLARLRRWQKFLAAGTAGLTVQQQRGLYGELLTLHSLLIPVLTPDFAVPAWRAPMATHQDFQFSTGAVEVKTTVAKQPETIRITSERQLDDTGIPALFLHVVVLDERVIEQDVTAGGMSLPALIADVRVNLASHPQLIERFDDSLLEAGYLDVDASRYAARRFALRHEHTFRVRDGFPRLTEKDLPEGVGDASYSLSLTACKPFTVTVSAMLKLLKPRLPGKKRNVHE